MLMRLIYASETAVALSPLAVQNIVETARAANRRRHITGALAFDSRSFLQVLEGEREAVSDLFCRIAKDPRHQRVQLLESLAVDERLFGHWAMGFAAADTPGRETFLRFSGDDTFSPLNLTAKGALGLLLALPMR